MIYSVFFGCVVGLNYILTPKLHSNTFMALDNFNEEHSITPFASVGDLKFYKTSFDNFHAFSNTLNSLFDVELEQEFKVNVEPNFVLVESSPSVPWHLQRVAQRELPLKGSFPYGKCHENTNVTINTYVIDTGIDVSHPEFEGRATWLANFIDNEDSDCNSHGTHCAGLVGSKTYGVCKDANLFAVKVLDCRGSGSTSAVIAGIDFAFKDHLNRRATGKNVKSIVSMSLGGGFSRALNMAVQATIKDPHFFFAAAAGNEDSDTCRTSPASSVGIFAVMASDRYDNRAYFSNYGKCASIFSPGVDIESTVPGGKTAVYSGTSMATPVFVGVLNHYLDRDINLTMKTLKEKVLSDATKNALAGVPKQTNNLFVYLNRA